MQLVEWFSSTTITSIFDIFYEVNGNQLSITFQDGAVCENDEHTLLFIIDKNDTLTTQLLYDEIIKFIGIDNFCENIVSHHPKILFDKIDELMIGIKQDISFKEITVEDATLFNYIRGTKDKIFFRHVNDDTEIYLNLNNYQVYLNEEKYSPPIDSGDGFTEKLIDSFYSKLKENICTPF